MVSKPASTDSTAMPHRQTDVVRQLVVITFCELGLSTEGSRGESLLVQGGHIVGRRFEYETGEVLWFIEEAELKFYDKNRCLLKVVRLEGSSRKAA